MRFLTFLIFFCAFSSYADHQITDPQILSLISKFQEQTSRLTALERNKNKTPELAKQIEAERGTAAALKTALLKAREAKYGDAGVVLQSKDNDYFYLNEGAAFQSEIIEGFVRDVGFATPMPLSYSSPLLRTLSSALTQIQDIMKKEDKVQLSIQSLKGEHKAVVRDVLIAANYLSIKPLLEAALEVYSEVLQRDAERIGEESPIWYQNYRQGFIDQLPGVLQNRLLDRLRLSLLSQGLEAAPIHLTSKHGIFGATLSPDSSSVATIEFAEKQKPYYELPYPYVPRTVLRLWDPRSPEPNNYFTLSNDTIDDRGIAFNPDSKTFWTVSNSGEIRLWNNAPSSAFFKNKPIAEYSIPNLPARENNHLALGVTPDGKILVVWNYRNLSLYSIDRPTGKIVRKADFDTGCSLVAVTKDSNTLVCTHRTAFSLWNISDTNAPRLIKKVNIDSQSGFSAFWADMSPDGKWLAIGSKGSEIRIWKFNGGDAEYFETLRHPPIWPVSEISFSPDNNLLSTSGEGDGVYFWSYGDASSACKPFIWPKNGKYNEDVNEHIFEESNFPKPCYWFKDTELVYGKFSSDGHLLVISRPGEVRIWRASPRVLDLVQAQIIRWAQSAKVYSISMMPKHLLALLNEDTRRYLFGE